MGVALKGLAIFWSGFYQQDQDHPTAGVDLLIFSILSNGKPKYRFLKSSF
jgi:hypothetical protein